MKRPSGKMDYVFLTMMLSIVAIGFVVLTSASGPVAVQRYGDVFTLVKRQALFGLLPGLFLMVILSHIDIRPFKRYFGWFGAVTVLLLISVFIPGIAADWGTSRSWIGVAGFSFQPIEVVKLTVVFALAGWFAQVGGRGLQDWRLGLVPFLCALGIVCGLVIEQPDTGSLMVIGGISVAMYLAAGAPWRDLGIIMVLGAGGIYVVIKSASYRAARLMTFLHPELDPQGIGYHINQAYLAIGNGGLFGLGLGHSRQKYLYLPEVAGDSIIAVMAEELGFIALVLFLVLYLAFCWRGLSLAKRSPDDFSRYVAIGIMTWVGGQAVLNIGSMVGLMPITGLPLPFVSHGGSALMMNLAAMGVMLSISRRATPIKSGKRK